MYEESPLEESQKSTAAKAPTRINSWHRNLKIFQRTLLGGTKIKVTFKIMLEEAVLFEKIPQPLIPNR